MSPITVTMTHTSITGSNTADQRSRCTTGINVSFGERMCADESILSQRKDPDEYPELGYLSQMYGEVRLYREWSFGRSSVFRSPQSADMPGDRLEETFQISVSFSIICEARRRQRIRSSRACAICMKDSMILMFASRAEPLRCFSQNAISSFRRVGCQTVRYDIFAC